MRQPARYPDLIYGTSGGEPVQLVSLYHQQGIGTVAQSWFFQGRPGKGSFCVVCHAFYPPLCSPENGKEGGRAKLLAPPQDLDNDGLSLNREANYFDALLSFLEERPRSGDDVIAAIAEKTLKGFREPTLSAFTAWLYERGGYASEETPYTLSESLERICLEFEELTVSSDDYRLVERYLQSLGLP